MAAGTLAQAEDGRNRVGPQRAGRQCEPAPAAYQFSVPGPVARQAGVLIGALVSVTMVPWAANVALAGPRALPGAAFLCCDNVAIRYNLLSRQEVAAWASARRGRLTAGRQPGVGME